ncbi:MAG: adenylosuccinate synthase [Clostridiales bacterium]|jgi:adenylosuccinate synthase|nr:adenylosuccinate synthase [Clostridiales bacterium]
MVRAIVGANWGDEGKGKITDMCAARADIVVRFQGGGNAGHTIINEYGKNALHLLPSGVFHKNVVNVIANGVALNIESLLEEIEGVKKSISAAGGEAAINLLVSDKAQVLMGHHILKDVYEEERLAERKFGSTKSGMAPFYADKFSKSGIQLWQLYDDGDLRAKIAGVCEKINIELKYLYKKDLLDPDAIYDGIMKLGEAVRPYVGDTLAFLRSAVREGKDILLEGQLGALRDVDHGIYPYTTSSNTLAGYAAAGAGIPPYEIKEILAVTKAYSSCVGEGPFVVELSGDEAEELRRRGGDAGEYGAKTGRPRRVGFFDAIAARYGCEVQGATCIALTGLDVMGYLKEIPVCVAYEIDGEKTESFPNSAKQYRAKPVYEYLPGWESDIRGAVREVDLPENAKRYVSFIEEYIGVPIAYISTGPKRDEIIIRQKNV